jgi:tetratricopeptide (TPR) repeat protein
MVERMILGIVFAVLFTTGLVMPVMSQAIIPPGASETGLGGGNAITGMILLSNGQRLQRRVAVRLQTMTKGDRIAMSDEYGNFTFRGLVTGEYTVVIDKEKEFEPFRQPIDIRQFRGSAPQTYTLNIRLQLKAEATAKPGVLNAEFANVPRKALAHYNDAIELSKKTDHLGAVEQLKLALAEYPSFTQAFNELGVQYLKLNRLEDADGAFQSALKITPDSLSALINRGIANVMMKRYGEAVPILRKALKKNDHSAVGHYFLGQALANLGLFDDAEKELLTSLELGGQEMKEAHRILAIIYSSRGARKQAADELEAYLKVAADTPDAEKLKEMIRRLKEPDE